MGETYMVVTDEASGVRLIDTRIEPGSTAAQGSFWPMGSWAVLSDGLDGFGSVSGTVSSDTYASGNGGIIHGVSVGIVTRTVKLRFRGPTCSPSGQLGTRTQTRAFMSKAFSPLPEVRVLVKYDGGVERSYRGTVSKVALSEGNIFEPLDLTFSISCPDPYVLVATRSKDATPPTTGSTLWYVSVADDDGTPYGIFKRLRIEAALTSDAISAVTLGDSATILQIQFPSSDELDVELTAAQLKPYMTAGAKAVTVALGQSDARGLSRIEITSDEGSAVPVPVPGLWQVDEYAVGSSYGVGVYASFPGYISAVSLTVGEYEVIL